MISRIIFVLFFLSGFYTANACQCPATSLSIAECNKYEIIFMGKIDSVKTCGNNFGTAYFTVNELYKGNVTKNFKVLFECGVPCAQEFAAGDEWIIYSNYKQIDNAIMDWCSRSRKYFRIEKQDFYTVNYGNTYSQELQFLEDNLGLHRLLVETKNAAENRNIRPSITTTILALVVSLLFIIFFYWLVNRYFKF